MNEITPPSYYVTKDPVLDVIGWSVTDVSSERRIASPGLSDAHAITRLRAGMRGEASPEAAQTSFPPKPEGRGRARARESEREATLSSMQESE